MNNVFGSRRTGKLFVGCRKPGDDSQNTNYPDGSTGVIHRFAVDRTLIGEVEDDNGKGEEDEAQAIQADGDGYGQGKGPV